MSCGRRSGGKNPLNVHEALAIISAIGICVDRDAFRCGCVDEFYFSGGLVYVDYDTYVSDGFAVASA